MTVKELIEKLKEYPEDMEVFTFGESVGGNEFDSEAWPPYLKTLYVKREESIERDYIAQRACKATAGSRKCLIL